MTNTAAMAAQRLIDQSLAERKAVHAQWTPELAEELSKLAMDRYEHGGLVTLWGRPKSAPWRVVLEAKPETASEPANLPPLAEVLLEIERYRCEIDGLYEADDGPLVMLETVLALVVTRDAELARLRAEVRRLRFKLAEVLRDNRDSREHSRRLRETIGEVVSAIEGSSVPVESEVAKMAARVVAERDRLRGLLQEALPHVQYISIIDELEDPASISDLLRRIEAAIQ